MNPAARPPPLRLGKISDLKLFIEININAVPGGAGAAGGMQKAVVFLS